MVLLGRTTLAVPGRVEVARGELRRSSLNDFLETSRDASSQLVANLNRAAELPLAAGLEFEAATYAFNFGAPHARAGFRTFLDK